MAKEKIPHEPSAAERAAAAQKQWTKQAKAQGKAARKERRRRSRATRLNGFKTPAISLAAFAVIVLVVALVQH